MVYTLSLLFRFDATQHRVADYITYYMQESTQLPISVGSVRVQQLNKIVLKEILVKDEKGDTAISIPKITAHISPTAFMGGNIRVNTLIVGTPFVSLNREKPGAPLNIQFLLDKLAGDSSSVESTIPDIRISHIQLYDGTFKYHEGGETPGCGTFDPAHINVSDINCSLALKKLNSDTLSLYIRSISGKEASGLALNRLRATVEACPGKASIEKLSIELPGSYVSSKKIALTTNGKGKFSIKGEIDGKKIAASDFSPLFPALDTPLPLLGLNITVNGNEKSTKAQINATTGDNSIALKSTLQIENLKAAEKRKIKLSLTDCTIKSSAIEHLQKLVGDSTDNLAILKRVGDAKLHLTANTDHRTIKGYIELNTPSGTLDGDFFADKEQNYRTSLRGNGVNIGRITGEKDIRKADIEINAHGDFKGEEPDGRVLAIIDRLNYKNYEYAPIEVYCTHNAAVKTATIRTVDDNASGHIQLTHNSKETKIRASIDSVKPQNLNFNYGEGTLSAIVEADFAKKEGEKTHFDAHIYNLTLTTPDDKKIIRSLNIADNNLSDTRYLIISSDFLDANIAGHFNYGELAGTFENIFHTHLSAISGSRKPQRTNNEYSFNFNIRNTEAFSHIFNLPITINEKSTINGSCDDNRKLFYINADINNADVNSDKYRNIKFTGFADNEKIVLDATLHAPQVVKNVVQYDTPAKDMKIEARAEIRDNAAKNRVHWTRNAAPVNNGTFEFDLALERGKNNTLSFTADIKPNEIVYNNNLWNISPCRVSGNGETFAVNNLHLNSNRQWIKVDGNIGKTDDDILGISLNDINMETIFDIVNFHSVEFGGDATGDITLSRLLDGAQFSSSLNVKKFTFEKGLLGELDFSAVWDDEMKAVLIHGDANDDEDNARTIVSGIISPANDTINLHIDANRTSLAFLNNYLDGILTDIKGNATGDVYVLGKLGEPNLAGKAYAEGSMKLIATNVTYNLMGDTVYMVPNRIALRDFPVTDHKNHKGRLSINIDHNSFDNFTCDLKAEADNLLAYHSEGFNGQPFYGTAYATGTIDLTANSKGIFLHANVRSNEGSSFVYDSSIMGSVTNNSFVTFTDNSKKLQTAAFAAKGAKPKKNYNSLLSRLNLEFMIEATPDLQLKVFTNLRNGDYIDLYGNGTIAAVFDEKEGFSMKGRLDLERGTYKFTMQDIFPKEFDIIKGSTLTFDGDPFQADLNLKTKYLVTGASLSDLDPEIERQKSVKVNCLMDITGKLEAPQLSFDIELPDANEEQRELLATAINTPEQKNMQFIYLMGIGKFYTFDYYRNADTNSQSSTAMESLISNTISGQLNNMLSQIIDNRNWNISGNFSSSEKGWNNMEVEGILEGRLLDNRLLINGNFGYRENPMANTNFVGDFEVQWILDKNGKVSLKAYNKTNDRYFTETTLTTQGAGIILRHDFNNWRWWLRNKK